MKVLVLGGDGFCGWPTALHLSAAGHDVVIADNLSRRKIDVELEVESLTPIRPLSERIAAWQRVSGRWIRVETLDIARNYHRLLTLIDDEAPGHHHPFRRTARRALLDEIQLAQALYRRQQLNATNKRAGGDRRKRARHPPCALGGPWGSMATGTAGMKIPEGYLKVKVGEEEQVEAEILYPANPGSIYHMTKTQDQLLFFFYNKNDGLRITDLHQGIVWGTQTDQTARDPALINRFDYDGDYGTVLNRFLMQAAVGHPLTVHGTGGQTRAFIHIQDTCRCIELAVNNPPPAGSRVNILNQMTETHRIRDLAAMIARMTGAEMRFVPNPRNEAAENDLHVANDRFLGLGLQPITLQEGLMAEVTEVARKYRDRARLELIPCRSTWTAPTMVAAE